MIPYFAVMLTDSFRVLGGDLARGLHILFAFVSPVYIPFGIIYYIQRQYLVCSIYRNCDSVTLRYSYIIILKMYHGLIFSDYMIVEIYILYFAILFHTVLWGFVLKAADIIKDGGTIKSMFQKRVAIVQNDDKIFDEDSDVRQEREIVEGYMADRLV